MIQNGGGVTVAAHRGPLGWQALAGFRVRIETPFEAVERALEEPGVEFITGVIHCCNSASGTLRPCSGRI